MTNIWERLADALDADTPIYGHLKRTLRKLAAEDAEREGHDPDCDPIGCKHDMTHDASPPVQGLPPFVDAINMLAIDGVISASRARELTGQPVFEQRAWFRAHRQEIESESERENVALLRLRTPAAASTGGQCADLRAGEADGNDTAGGCRDDDGAAEVARSEGLLRASGIESAEVKSGGEGSLPALDPALVEECARAYWESDSPPVPWNDLLQGLRARVCGDVTAALNHYRERVEGPLRELAEQRREALEYERGETRRAADASAFYQREADRLRRELAAARNLIAVGEKQRDVLLKANTLLAAQRDAHSNARQAWQAKAEGDFAPQPTDEERQRLADMARYYGGQGASSLVYVRADDMRRIATLLEQPAPAFDAAVARLNGA